MHGMISIEISPSESRLLKKSSPKSGPLVNLLGIAAILRDKFGEEGVNDVEALCQRSHHGERQRLGGLRVFDAEPLVSGVWSR